MLRDPSTHHLGQMKIEDFFPHTFFTTLEMRKKVEKSAKANTAKPVSLRPRKGTK